MGLFISQANLMVTEELSSIGFSDDRLALIETYLAAHFAALVIERGALASIAIQDVKDAFHDVYSEGLGSTRFGQQAMMLDTSGTLVRLSASLTQTKLNKAEFRIV